MATRLYFTNSGTISGGFTPSTNPELLAGWDATAVLSTRPWVTTAGSDTKSTLVQTVLDSTGNINRVTGIWVSDTIATGTTLFVGGGMASMQMRVATSANDGYAEIAIYRYSGGVYTLIAYKIPNVTTVALTNRTSLPSNILPNVVLSTGDRLVAYLNAGNDSGGITPTVSFRIGANSGTADLPVDNSTTTDLNPWIEFSETFTFAAAASGTSYKLFSSSTRRNRRH